MLIEFGPKSKRTFVIRCRPHENDLPANLPDRYWDGAAKTWRAYVCRRNAEVLNNNRQKFDMSDEVRAVLDEYAAKTNDVINKAPFPETFPFTTEPMPHQLDAVKKMYGLPYFALFMDIGTGKTKVLIDIATAMYGEGKIHKVLTIGLVSIKLNWEDEIKKHGRDIRSIHLLDTSPSGKKKYRKWLSEQDGFGLSWLMIGIESFSNGSAFELAKEFADEATLMVVDESDSIKNHKAARTGRCKELGESAGYRAIMTGTPLTQGIIDLYSQFGFLDLDIIGIASYEGFRNRYAVMGGHEGKQIVGYQRVDELVALVSPFVYQVRKRDVLKDLPPASYQKLIVEMSAEQKKVYAELKNTMKIMYEGRLLTVANSINLMQRFSEITGGFVSYLSEPGSNPFIPDDMEKKPKYEKMYLKSNPKLDELMAFISRLPNDEPLIVWAISKMEVAAIINTIHSKYPGDGIAEMHGGVDEEERKRQLDSFNAGNLRFLVGNQGVGGIGLNMVRACIMAYFSNDFSMRKRDQSEGRIERIGQKRPMLYVDIMCRGTIDQYIHKALSDKQDFAEVVRALFGSGGLLDLV